MLIISSYHLRFGSFSGSLYKPMGLLKINGLYSMLKFLVLKTLTTRIVYNKGLESGCTRFKSASIRLLNLPKHFISMRIGEFAVWLTSASIRLLNFFQIYTYKYRFFKSFFIYNPCRLVLEKTCESSYMDVCCSLDLSLNKRK